MFQIDFVADRGGGGIQRARRLHILDRMQEAIQRKVEGQEVAMAPEPPSQKGACPLPFILQFHWGR